MPTYFTVKEKRYEIITIESLSWREAREVKRISGLPMGQIPLAMVEQDPDALVAVMVVSMQRTDPATTEFALMAENMNEVLETFETIAEVDESRPDPSTASLSNGGGSDADAPTSTETSETTGTPAGSASSA